MDYTGAPGHSLFTIGPTHGKAASGKLLLYLKYASRPSPWRCTGHLDSTNLSLNNRDVQRRYIGRGLTWLVRIQMRFDRDALNRLSRYFGAQMTTHDDARTLGREEYRDPDLTHVLTAALSSTSSAAR